MSQQQYYQQPAAPAYPQAPQQAYPPQQIQPQFPQAPTQGYPQQVQQPAPYAAPQPPAQPLAQGSIDDFYNQPSVGGGPSISWTNKDGSQKPLNTSYAGIVVRDVTQADVQQETDFKTQQPKFYRDGRPKFVMKVPLRVQPSPEFPDGEAAFYVKGQSRDELVRAMAEAGCSGAPTAGSGIVITLVQRKPMGQGMNPANIVQVQYQPVGGAPAAPVQQAPAEVPAQAQPVQQYAPVEQPQQFQQPLQAAPISPQAQAVPQGQAPQLAQPVAQPVQQQAAPQPPSDLSPEQQQLLARLTGGQAAS